MPIGIELYDTEGKLTYSSSTQVGQIFAGATSLLLPTPDISYSNYTYVNGYYFYSNAALPGIDPNWNSFNTYAILAIYFKGIDLLYNQYVVELKNGKIYFRQSISNIIISLLASTAKVSLLWPNPDTGQDVPVPGGQQHVSKMFDFYLTVYSYGDQDLSVIRV